MECPADRDRRGRTAVPQLFDMGTEQEVMDDRTSQALRSAGWRPGRSIGRSTAETLILDAGVSPTAEQIDFVEQFSRLNVTFRRGDWDDSFWIDVAEAVSRASRERVADYGERAGENLLPVGFSNSEHLLLLLGPDGSLYGGFDDFFRRLGDRADDSLEWIVWRQDEIRPE